MAGKQRTHCFRGHELTPENTYTSPTNHRYCKKCKRTAQSKTLNKIKSAEGIKNWHLRIRYGLTPEQYQQMLKDSEGRCAICQREMEVPHIDHNHTTKKVRELLCKFCNTGLGMFGESLEVLARAITYLQKHDIG